MKYLTGIGSRSTPQNILDHMYQLAISFSRAGWTLRSGGADGADKIFEQGFKETNGVCEIYLPWTGFNQSNSQFNFIKRECYDIARKIHPAFDTMSVGGQKLHARNVYQVLGYDLNRPSDLVICYTPKGELVGGTRTAIVLAKEYNIPVINLGI